MIPDNITAKDVVSAIRKISLEEWLFDMDKIIDGYHYGRIEPLYTKSGNHIGKTYHLTLFSNNSEEKQWYWVGRIENAKVLTPEESETII